jgi:hypothetical protein
LSASLTRTRARGSEQTYHPRQDGLALPLLVVPPVWNLAATMWMQMKTLSPRSWRVIARGSGHAVHHARLDLVVREIGLLIQYLGGGPAPPFGTTTVQ